MAYSMGRDQHEMLKHNLDRTTLLFLDLKEEFESVKEAKLDRAQFENEFSNLYRDFTSLIQNASLKGISFKSASKYLGADHYSILDDPLAPLSFVNK